MLASKNDILSFVEKELDSNGKYHAVMVFVDDDGLLLEEKKIYIEGCFLLVFLILVNFVIQKTKISLKDLGHLLNLLAVEILLGKFFEDDKELINKTMNFSFFKGNSNKGLFDILTMLLNEKPSISISVSDNFTKAKEELKKLKIQELFDNLVNYYGQKTNKEKID